MRDELVEKIFCSIRTERIDSNEKMRALVRAGEIAKAYFGEPDSLLQLVFGCDDTIQHDVQSNSLAGHNRSQ